MCARFGAYATVKKCISRKMCQETMENDLKPTTYFTEIFVYIKSNAEIGFFWAYVTALKKEIKWYQKF